MSILKPFNLNKWVDENRHLLKPPVGNKNIYVASDDYIIMIVAGPNARKDYHYNETEELFYQLEGTIKIIIQDNGERKEMELHPGDMYLNPAKIHHSPVRNDGSIGLVVERKRAGKGFTDGLIWYCEKCNNKLHEVFFELQDIEKDFLPHYQNFYTSEKLRTCKKCSFIMESDSRFL
jgi:3-hydroxyanthranilate 3,4-dioxygenase